MSMRERKGAFFLAVLVFSVSSVGQAAGEPDKSPVRNSYQLRAFALGAGGAPSARIGYESNSTLGQATPIGVASAGGNTLYAGFWGQVAGRTPTGIETPATFRNKLFQNYPNPFNPTTAVKYSVAAPARVVIRIFNVRGQVVRTLVNEHKTPGFYMQEWDGTNDAGLTVASGVYFCRLGIGTFGSVKKLVLLK